MKLHEKAKELGVKSGELQAYLNKGGADIKSPNQELTSEMESLADKMIQFPASVNIPTTPHIAVAMTDDNVVRILRMTMDGDKLALIELLEEKKFPSKAQAFAHIEYCWGRIEVGVFNV